MTEAKATRKRAAKRKPAGLNAQQKQFVAEYLLDHNATQAAIRAGYSTRTAQEQGSRLLSNVMVQEAIQAALARVISKLEIKAEDVLREAVLLAFSDIGQLLDFSGTEPRLRPCSEIPEAARRAIASVKVRRFTEGHGEEAREVEVTEFKLWSKLDALEKLFKHLDLFKTTVKHEHAGPGGGPITVKHAPDLDDFRKLPVDERIRILRAAVLVPPGGRGGGSPAA